MSFGRRSHATRRLGYFAAVNEWALSQLHHTKNVIMLTLQSWLFACADAVPLARMQHSFCGMCS